MANSLHWFRKGLRIHDNQPLRDAIQGSSTFRAVFFLDRATVKNAKVSVNRWRFLLECLRDLDSSLQEFGTRLYIVQGHPIDVFPRLIKEWGITRLTFEYDSEPYPSQRDLAVRRLAENEGVEVIVKTSHSLFDISKFLEENNGQAPITFKQFHALLKKVGLPEPCVETVKKDLFGSCVMPVEDDHDEKYGIPSFRELGLPLEEEQGSGVWTGGEAQALRLLQKTIRELLQSDKRTSKKIENSPFPKSSKLSPYLRFGCISPRLVFHEMTKLTSKVNNSAACIGIQKSLLWREFFFVIASKNPSLDKMCNNCMCLQFPWDKDNGALERWKEGKTGFPWIDAIMRQLREEGWIHHMARQAVGCFLTRGCLWISWEEGFKAFEELQLDAEWSLNASCWLWLSCSAFFNSNPIPWYCPINFGKKLDPVGSYVRRYVPEIKNLPNEFIFEPWLAPADVQKKAGCVIGVNYPKNLLDPEVARKICSSRMREVYSGLVVKVSCAPGLGHNVVHWFRKDLRLHDNPALLEALPNCRAFYAVYIFDPVNIKAAKVSANRWNFLLECLRDLDNNLKKCGTRLHVLRGQPTTIFPKLFREWNITKLTLESECEPFGQQRDEAIASLAEEYGVEMCSRSSHTLYSIDKILEMNGGKCPTLFKEFESTIRKLGPPDNPVDSVRRKNFSSCICPITSTHEERYGVPTLSELNINPEQVTCGDLWVGGETEALTRLTELEEKILIGNHTKGSPESAAALLPSRTQLSPYLRFGCLSPKMYYRRLTMAYIKMQSKPPPMSLYCQLVWREFFFTLASKNPNMDTIENNPLCLEIKWEHNDEALTRWKEGKTGFPWIDAIMRQLRKEGWIHHIARQAVGCFLTRGCLWISWEEGFKVFEELQLDAEWSVNSGSWLWLSCSAFFHSQIPWFCPVSVGKKLDPSGNYIRKYIPELRTMPNKYIYHPWTAPEGIQKAANCVIGKDYPEPIADYIERRKLCLERLKEVCHEIKTTTESAITTIM